jgi:hypothetical protein
MKKITEQEFQAITPLLPLFKTAGRGWYQHEELLGIVLETESSGWHFEGIVGESTAALLTTSCLRVCRPMKQPRLHWRGSS